MSQNRFSKSERLYLNAHKAKLFASKNSLVSYPFRVIYVSGEGLRMRSPLEVLISVPKKKIRHAVDRNLIKRRSREAYRLHKSPLLESLSAAYQCDDEGNANASSLLIGIIYLPKKILPYSKIEEGIQKALLKLEERLAGRKAESHEG